MRALSTRNDEPERASRPFDKDRDGFIVGEGAGVLILEELRAAHRRAARAIYAELVGYGMSADAYHITAPSEDGDGAFRVMNAAHGERRRRRRRRSTTSTRTARRRRTATSSRRSRSSAASASTRGKLAVSSTKSMTGHLLGAAGGLEAGITALAVYHQVAPPTINLDSPDPECDLDYVPNAKPCRSRSTYALSNSFGFGGTNAALLFRFEARFARLA